MKLRYTYRIRPGATVEAALWREAGMARWVWNQAVERAKNKQPWFTSEDLTAARNNPETAWLAEGSSVVQQQVLRDFKASKHLKKFKSARTSQPSMNYTSYAFTLKEVDGKLRLSLAGKNIIPVVWSRELPAPPTSVRVYRRPDGHWYASFVVECEDQPLPASEAAIGIDWGVKAVATTTNPEFDLPHPEHGRKKAAQLAAAQKRMARRKPAPFQPASKGYKQAKLQTAKIYQSIANQRQDTARKWAKKIIQNHGFIAVEDFKPAFLAKSTMAKKAADAMIGATKRELISMAERAGRQVVTVTPAYTTMTCSNCTARTKQKLSLSQRVFVCETCGFELDRDLNAARNILATAGFDGASAETVRPNPNRKVEAGLVELGIPRL